MQKREKIITIMVWVLQDTKYENGKISLDFFDVCRTEKLICFTNQIYFFALDNH